MPWYRALPGSCIAGAKLTVDGVERPRRSRCAGRMNGREFSFDELVDETGEWWFPTDSAVLSGELPVADSRRRARGPGRPHALHPVHHHSDTETLHIEEHDTKTMKAVAAMTSLGTPIQGVTLYSFTRAFHGREYDLEGLIRKVAAEGYGPGLEVIGFSSFRGFPDRSTTRSPAGSATSSTRSGWSPPRSRSTPISASTATGC